jgi:hypothetical protein
MARPFGKSYLLMNYSNFVCELSLALVVFASFWWLLNQQKYPERELDFSDDCNG